MPWPRRPGISCLWCDNLRSKAACAASPRAAAASEGANAHASRAALRPGTAAVVKRSAGLDCVPVSRRGFRGESRVRKFYCSLDGVDASIVSSSGFGGAADFSMFKLAPRMEPHNGQWPQPVHVLLLVFSARWCCIVRVRTLPTHASN